MSVLAPIFNQAQQGRSWQKSSLTALYKALNSNTAGSAQFLECVDVCLASKTQVNFIENTMDFISRAVFVKNDFLMKDCLRVRNFAENPNRTPQAGSR